MGSATKQWLHLIRSIMDYGFETAPRGLATLEIPHATTHVDMRYPVVALAERKLNYRFMAAEALWILDGSEELAEIAPWNHRMADYSDNGKTLWGAYGPRVAAQLDYVVQTLKDDVQSRQAVMVLWRPEIRYERLAFRKVSKDVPCTVALTFRIRGGKLDCHAFMRSNDAWLGWPYDVFTFTMIAATVAVQLQDYGLELGALYHTAASSHLYKEHWSKCNQLIAKVNDPMFLAPRPGPYLSLAFLKAPYEYAVKESLTRWRDQLPANEGRWNFQFEEKP